MVEEADGEVVVRRTRVVEQRVTHLAMGLLTIGCMSRPLLVVLYVLVLLRSSESKIDEKERTVVSCLERCLLGFS